MVSISECFSESYAEARPKFCSAAAAAGGALRSWLNPKARGPGGEALYLDTARFGPTDAANMLVLIAATILPKEWNEASQAETTRAFDAYAQKHGAFGLQSALSGGQYAHADGIFFGGHAPTWSNRTVRAIARAELSATRRVGVIDFHTGLGPFGHGELICAMAPTAKSCARAKAWYGEEMTSPESGTSTSAVVVGVMTDAFPQELPDAEVTSIAIEYGTYTVPEVLGAVRADNWLHQRGDLKSALGKTIKADIKERFFPSGDKWREMVWSRAEQTIAWAVKGMNGQ